MAERGNDLRKKQLLIVPIARMSGGISGTTYFDPEGRMVWFSWFGSLLTRWFVA